MPTKCFATIRTVTSCVDLGKVIRDLPPDIKVRHQFPVSERLLLNSFNIYIFQNSTLKTQRYSYSASPGLTNTFKPLLSFGTLNEMLEKGDLFLW